MRALILITGAALALAATPAAARPEHGERHHDHDRYESPYSNAAMRRERERKEFAREIVRQEREERRKQRAYRAYDSDDDDDADRSEAEDDGDPDDGE
jgi:hypothetical protein